MPRDHSSLVKFKQDKASVGAPVQNQDTPGYVSYHSGKKKITGRLDEYLYAAISLRNELSCA